MASAIQRKNKDGKTLWTIQFTLGTRRPCVPLGPVSKANAMEAKGYIESLAACRRSNTALSQKTAAWLADVSDDFYAVLVDRGLCDPKVTSQPAAPPVDTVPKLGAFIDGYIAGRAKMKPGTIINLNRCRNALVDHFGVGRALDSITPGDCDDFREKLRGTLAENTVRRICGRGKQFFRAAVRKKLIAESPFGDMKGVNVTANRSRDYFVTRDEAAKILKACPNNEWKLIFALSRFGGLRCPSEHLELRWGDVNWKLNRITVRSPKTAHYAGHEERVMPLWPELRTLLKQAHKEWEAAFDVKAERMSEHPVIRRYRGTNANLRTQLRRIIKNAGLVPWAKLFTNCRASRATELANEFPGHVAAAWLGHSEKIADAHYRQVTDDHFTKAAAEPTKANSRAANAQQQSAETAATGGNDCCAEIKKQHDVRISRRKHEESVTPTGLEPVLPP